jgi:peroxiredoxin
MLRPLCFLIFALGAAFFVNVSGRAADLKIGDAAPDWSGIVGVDDKTHGLSDYKDAKLLVVVFTCNHCPVAQAYQDRLISLQKDFKDKGVQFVAVNVNNIPEDRLDKMKERAKSKGFNFPYLYDSTQKIGHDYGATTTPHVFVLDQSRKLAYMGGVDDNMKADKAEKHYLRDAIAALLAGKTPPDAETKHLGCTIKYEDKK